jgi:hypothetical protein
MEAVFFFGMAVRHGVFTLLFATPKGARVS